MFVKNFFIATIVTALFAITFSSCTHDDAVNVNDYETTYNGKFNSLSQNTSVEFRELVHYAFFGVSTNVYCPSSCCDVGTVTSPVAPLPLIPNVIDTSTLPSAGEEVVNSVMYAW